MGRHSTPQPARADAAQPQPEPQPRPVVDVLFVCTANLCRSPVAEHLARAQLTGSGLAVGSAGVHAQPGTAMDDEAAAALNTTTLDPAVDSTAGSPRERSAAVVSRAVALRGALAPERPGDDVGDPYRQGSDAMRATVTEIDAWLRPLTALLVSDRRTRGSELDAHGVAHAHLDRVNLMADHYTLRLAPGMRQRLHHWAACAGLPERTLAQRYVEEGLRHDAHPLIRFLDGPSGRRAS